jgi:hypothetical protein
MWFNLLFRLTLSIPNYKKALLFFIDGYVNKSLIYNDKPFIAGIFYLSNNDIKHNDVNRRNKYLLLTNTIFLRKSICWMYTEFKRFSIFTFNQIERGEPL